MKHDVVAASFGIFVLSSIVGTAAADGRSTFSTYDALPSNSANLRVQVQAEQQKPVPPADDAPLTREQILKQGPAALQQNCTRCHGSDKWEGTNRDHDGWRPVCKPVRCLSQLRWGTYPVELPHRRGPMSQAPYRTMARDGAERRRSSFLSSLRPAR